MNIEKVIELIANRLTTLNGFLSTATSLGDIDEVIRIKKEILEVESTLIKLRSLL